ncbi:hypothetical protein DM01DRAFT_1408108 [Hesseltinella vesiculosa]|uniref:C2H2-type domain-containing protein n=1 Tax=Hesseltinella vesiculosa TaxID=101127 RepID=A0A1X2GFX2_9FUNG|nr:hypothetical protein DM01DRAFT_1408108 [Hesseltinella vesiculosa]
MDMDLDHETWQACSSFAVDILTGKKRKQEETSTFGSFDHRRNLENVFCHNFICCNQHWSSLHDLLEHEEACHNCTADTYRETNMQDRKPEHISEDGMDEGICGMEEDDGDDDDEDPLPTPESPLTSGMLHIPSPFIPQHITNADLTLLENANANASGLQKKLTMMLSTLPPTLGPSPTMAYSPSTVDMQHEECGYEKIKDWMQQAQKWLDHHDNDGDGSGDDHSYRPYKCTVDGCDKTYKNANGLKYHRAHGHCEDKEAEDSCDLAAKPYICILGQCKKRYKNLNGLKYHIQHTHCKRRSDAVAYTLQQFVTKLLSSNDH